MIEIQVEVRDVVAAYFLSKLFERVRVFVLEGRTWAVEVTLEPDDLERTLDTIRRWAKDDHLGSVVVHIDGERQEISPTSIASKNLL